MVSLKSEDCANTTQMYNNLLFILKKKVTTVLNVPLDINFLQSKPFIFTLLECKQYLVTWKIIF